VLAGGEAVGGPVLVEVECAIGLGPDDGNAEELLVRVHEWAVIECDGVEGGGVRVHHGAPVVGQEAAALFRARLLDDPAGEAKTQNAVHGEPILIPDGHDRHRRSRLQVVVTDDEAVADPSDARAERRGNANRADAEHVAPCP
jgi:hypothetical protein